MRTNRGIIAGLRPALLILAAVFLGVAVLGGTFWMDQPAQAQQAGAAPGDAPTGAEFWREIRRGGEGKVSIPNRQAAVLMQSDGEAWQTFRSGELSNWGVWGMVGTIALLALFFAVRGRIRIEAGRSAQRIERFKAVERFGHWLTASSFVVLGLTGLNLLYGRSVLLPLIGKEAFAQVTILGKYVHNYVAFAFMAGLVLIFAMWIRHNLPDRTDLTWLAKGGGFLSKHSHPPARKFNAGQKVIFWLTILGGLSLSLSGWTLMFPFEYAMFAKTFSALNLLGLGLPTAVTPMQEMQLAQLWHTVMALFLIAVILAHIYIGTIGMEGAFDAMGSGQVDLNWAKEHHGLWVDEELEGRRRPDIGTAPTPSPTGGGD